MPLNVNPFIQCFPRTYWITLGEHSHSSKCIGHILYAHWKEKRSFFFRSPDRDRVSLSRRSQQRCSWTRLSRRYQVSLNERIKTRSYSHAATSECHFSLSCLPPALSRAFLSLFYRTLPLRWTRIAPGGDLTVSQLVAVGLARLCESVKSVGMSSL